MGHISEHDLLAWGTLVIISERVERCATVRQVLTGATDHRHDEGLITSTVTARGRDMDVGFVWGLCQCWVIAVTFSSSLLTDPFLYFGTHRKCSINTVRRT